MTSIKVYRDKPNTTILFSGYHLYVDTILNINNKIYGTFMTEYNPLDEDLLLKKLPDLSSLSLSRDVNVDKRYLHIVNRSNKESIKGLEKLLSFEFKDDAVDDRTVLIDNDKVTVIDYSSKSVAIFVKDKKLNNDLKVNKFLKFNMNLTGPKMEKTPGYVMSKSSKGYASMMESFGEDSVLDVNEEFSGNGTNQLETTVENSLTFIIWGEQAYVESKIDELKDEELFDFRIISKELLGLERSKIIVELINKN